MTEERIQQLKDFYVSNKCVCPFARRLEKIVFGSLTRDPNESRIKHPILQICRNSDVLAAVYVFPTDLGAHLAEETRVNKLFKQLHRLLTRTEYKIELTSTEERELDEALLPTSIKIPQLAYKGKVFFTIAMNPLYPSEHPRSATVASVVITRVLDVYNADVKIRDRIREEIKSRVCGNYDAKPIYLDPTRNPVLKTSDTHYT